MSISSANDETESLRECSGCKDCAQAKFPLHKAASVGHVECLRTILDSLKDSTLLVDNYDNTPIHAAAVFGQNKTLHFLLENTQIPVRARNTNGETCAHVAAQHGKLDCLKLLLSGPLKRAQDLASEQDNLGCSLLHSAVLVNDNDIAQWLLQRFGKGIANLPSQDGILPLHVAASQGNIEFIRIATKYDLNMANKRDRNGATVAFYGVQGGHFECLKYMIEKSRADIHATTNKGQSLLHAACLNGHGTIAHWLLSHMDKNAIFQHTNDAATTFHCAAYSGYMHILKLLHKTSGGKKLLVNGADCRGNTPLHLTAIKNHLGACKFLLDIGADSKVKNKNGNTALEIAERRQHKQLAAILSSYKGGKDQLKRQMKESGNRLYRIVSGSKRRPTAVSTSGYGSICLYPSDNQSYSRVTLPMPSSRGPSVKPEPSSGYGSSSENLPQNFIPKTESGRNLLTWEPKGETSFDGTLSLERGNWLLRRSSKLESAEVQQKIIKSESSPAAPNLYIHNPNSESRRFQHRRFIHHATQTDPDPLKENICIVDEEEKIIWCSVPTTLHQTTINKQASISREAKRTQPIASGFGTLQAIVNAEASHNKYLENKVPKKTVKNQEFSEQGQTTVSDNYGSMKDQEQLIETQNATAQTEKTINKGSVDEKIKRKAGGEAGEFPLSGTNNHSVFAKTVQTDHAAPSKPDDCDTDIHRAHQVTVENEPSATTSVDIHKHKTSTPARSLGPPMTPPVMYSPAEEPPPIKIPPPPLIQSCKKSITVTESHSNGKSHKSAKAVANYTATLSPKKDNDGSKSDEASYTCRQEQFCKREQGTTNNGKVVRKNSSSLNKQAVHQISKEDRNICGSRVTHVLQQIKEQNLTLIPPSNGPPGAMGLNKLEIRQETLDLCNDNPYRYFGVTNASGSDLKNQLQRVLRDRSLATVNPNDMGDADKTVESTGFSGSTSVLTVNATPEIEEVDATINSGPAIFSQIDTLKADFV